MSKFLRKIIVVRGHRVTREQYDSEHGLMDFWYREDSTPKGIGIVMRNNKPTLVVNFKSLCGDRRIQLSQVIDPANPAQSYLSLMVRLFREHHFTTIDAIRLYRAWPQIAERYADVLEMA